MWKANSWNKAERIWLSQSESESSATWREVENVGRCKHRLGGTTTQQQPKKLFVTRCGVQEIDEEQDHTEEDRGRIKWRSMQICSGVYFCLCIEAQCGISMEAQPPEIAGWGTERLRGGKVEENERVNTAEDVRESDDR